jgi:hypothetical protein
MTFGIFQEALTRQQVLTGGSGATGVIGTTMSVAFGIVETTTN